jgi:acyl transferase domain-containing protein
MLDLELPSTLVFDYPNIDGIVSAISSKMELPIESSQYLPAMAAITDKDEASHFKRCYLVAYFSSMDSQQQVKGKAVSEDLISRIPLGRWDCGWNSIHEHLPVFGYFLEDIEHFDPTMFRISELEAVEMDPQQRKLLGSWSNCHYNMSVPKETGIYVGVSQLDYSILLWSTRLRNAKMGTSTFSATSSHLSVVSGRLSYLFGYTGQCLSVDTACSSSLVVANLASNELGKGSICGAGISGVNLVIARTWSQACNSAGMLSTDGRCKVLDASADGYVRSEECSSAYLSCESKHASYAICLMSSAVNQDGRSSTLTAPNGPAQQNVICRAFEESESSNFLNQLQMHGTGTALGDPIEIGAVLALSEQLQRSSDELLELQAGKSQHGHSEPAAGLSALINAMKASMELKNAQLFHLVSMNSHVSHLLERHPKAPKMNVPRMPHPQTMSTMVSLV